MHACTYACTHVCMDAWMYVCVHAYMIVYVYMYSVYTCPCAYNCVYVYVYVNTCIYICYVLYRVIRSAHTYTSMTLIDLGKNRFASKRFKQRVPIIFICDNKIALDQFSGPTPWSSIRNCRLSHNCHWATAVLPFQCCQWKVQQLQRFAAAEPGQGCGPWCWSNGEPSWILPVSPRQE